VKLLQTENLSPQHPKQPLQRDRRPADVAYNKFLSAQSGILQKNSSILFVVGSNHGGLLKKAWSRIRGGEQFRRNADTFQLLHHVDRVAVWHSLVRVPSFEPLPMLTRSTTGLKAATALHKVMRHRPEHTG
jgi:hypothetical protein